MQAPDSVRDFVANLIPLLNEYKYNCDGKTCNCNTDAVRIVSLGDGYNHVQQDRRVRNCKQLPFSMQVIDNPDAFCLHIMSTYQNVRAVDVMDGSGKRLIMMCGPGDKAIFEIDPRDVHRVIKIDLPGKGIVETKGRSVFYVWHKDTERGRALAKLITHMSQMSRATT